MERLTFYPEHSDEGTRLDVYLASELEDVTRSAVQKLIEQGQVACNGKSTKSNTKLKAGDVILVEKPDARPLEIVPEPMALDILYEDDMLIVVNKPQGVVVHPAAGHSGGTLVNGLLHHCGASLSGINGVLRPGIVHRIDKDTSGVLVAAKNDAAHQSLGLQLADHSMTRRYKALARGQFKNACGTVNASIGRHPTERKKMAVVKTGKSAITHYTVLNQFKDSALMEARLETGRTHQIRVHMAHIGHPLVGDPVYGPQDKKFKNAGFEIKGQALHAEVLGFIHPKRGDYMEFSAPLPSYFENLIKKQSQECFKTR